MIIIMQLGEVNHNRDLLTAESHRLKVTECWLPRLRVTLPGCWRQQCSVVRSPHHMHCIRCGLLLQTE